LMSARTKCSSNLGEGGRGVDGTRRSSRFREAATSGFE
jgi:hypothetical protein